MGRFTRLPSAVLFRLGLITCCGALLAGLMLIMLGLPHAGQAQGGAADIAIFATHTPTPTRTPAPTATSTPVPTATSTPRPTATSTPKPAPSSTAPATATPGRSKGALGKVPSWLTGGLVGVFVILLAFSLIIFPLAMRSARAERRGRPTFTVAPPRRPSGQVARLTQIPPERKQPLSREQMLALHESQQLAATSGVSEHSTASLAAIRVVDGVPVSLPITEAETAQLPVARRSVVGKIVETTTARLQAIRPDSALPPPAQRQTQRESERR